MDRETAIATVKARIKCADYLKKSKHGGYCCPFCGSGTGTHRTGALKIYDTNTWTCHACGKSGDVIDLMVVKYNTDFNGALNMAVSELGLNIDRYNAPESARSDFKPNDVKIYHEETKAPENATDLTEYFRVCRERITEQAAASYLTARGISTDTAASLGVGYDPAADPAGSGYKTPRIIIPTTKSHYVGRSIDSNTEKSYQKMNNKGGRPGIFNETALYSGQSVVYVLEGAFDAMSVCEMGAAAIGLNSTSNTGRLLDLLKERPAATGTGFIVSLDNDSDPKTAARTNAAAESLYNGLLQLGYDCIQYNIAGSHKDANEALTANKEEFRRLLAAAEQALRPDYLADFLEKIQTEAYKPYKTELSFFDDLLGGGVIQQSLLIVMAAPGTGKTTLCQQIAEEMAAHKKPVIYINLEMSREQMLAKAISYWMARDGKRLTALDVLQGYNWGEDTRELVTAAIDKYRRTAYPFIQYNPGSIGSDLDGILAYLQEVGERAKATGEQAPAVIVDYLHLISTSKGLDNQELIKQTVTGLKDYAVKYNSFVIGISATNRASNSAGKITMESGRDSSNIEYTGDYQLSLNYDLIDRGIVKPTDTEQLAELHKEPWRKMIIRVLKGRFVTPGKSAQVYFHAANNIFYGKDDWMPADPERVPFEQDKPKETRRRY